MSISSIFQFPPKSLKKSNDDQMLQKIKILEQEIEVLKKMNRKLCFSVDLLMSEATKGNSNGGELKRVS
ncbi:MAG: hypothetical protein KC646_09215 [Candidatus Cloacimonetes bacterium]|nr:hypothetical protein [Candidatus Cloacimonadota bacterium]